MTIWSGVWFAAFLVLYLLKIAFYPRKVRSTLLKLCVAVLCVVLCVVCCVCCVVLWCAVCVSERVPHLASRHR